MSTACALHPDDQILAPLKIIYWRYNDRVIPQLWNSALRHWRHWGALSWNWNQVKRNEAEWKRMKTRALRLLWLWPPAAFATNLHFMKNPLSTLLNKLQAQNMKLITCATTTLEGWVRAGKIWTENRSKLPSEVDMYVNMIFVEAKRNLNPARQGPWQGIHGRNIRDIVPDPSDQIVEYCAVCVDVSLERSGSMKTSLAAMLVS